MNARMFALLGFALISMSAPAIADENKDGAQANPAETSKAQLGEKDRAAKQAKIRKMRDLTLQRLYKTNPKARAEIAEAVGYAVFDASQTNIILLVTSKGGGLMFDNASQKETFMKMNKIGTGPGVGHKKFKQILVFKSRGLFDTFASLGADVTASADATMKLKEGDKGTVLDGTSSFNPNLSVYQLTDSGLMLQANWGGVTYRPDSDLNSAPPTAK
jgi:lipid-binding SYLF domain-containing protein